LDKTQKGKFFEDRAVKYLESIGYKVLLRNYRSKYGEIDIIAETDNVIVFVEVKGRFTESFGSGEESITKKKIDKIIKTALQFIEENNLQEKDFRFDVVAFKGNQIFHLENAFSLE
jgi:putative endonuclease